MFSTTVDSKDIIAVVDDDPDSRASFAALVASMGMQCRESASAEEFLLQSRQTPPSCLVIDYRLPGMDGIALMEQLAPQADPPEVIFVSGFATIHLAVRMMQSGAFTVMEKPCTDQDLGDAIQKAVKHYHQMQTTRARLRNWRERVQRLNESELQVARGIATGTPNALLAERLQIGLRTVEKRRHQIFRKLEVETLPALVELLFHVMPELLEHPSGHSSEPEDKEN